MDGKSINIDQEFWNDFILEAFEHIEEIETNVLTLEQNPDDMDIIHTMFRAFHTIKGLSGFVEHSIIQGIAHKTETLMDYCRKGEMVVDTKIVDAILKSSDYIKQLCEDMDSCKDDDFISKIEAHVSMLEEMANLGESAVKNTDSVVQAVESFQEEVQANPEPEKSADDMLKEFAELEIEKDVIVQEEPQESAVEEIEVQSVEVVVEESKPEEEKVEEVKAFEIDIEALKAKFASAETQNVEQGAEQSAEHGDAQDVAQNTEPPAEQPKEEAVEEEKVVEVETPIAVQIEERRGGDRRTGDRRAEDRRAEDPSLKRTVSAPEEHMKVANSKIDHLVDMIGELIINQSLIEQYIHHNYSHDNQLSTNMSGFLRITRELQSLSMSLRMVSLRPTFQKITRIARDTIQELSKDVEFVTSGDATEIDRVVTDKLLDPLVHMIKNAISHGIEKDSQDRINVGKQKKGRVELNAYNKRGKIFIEVKDDGRGINTDVVYKKALEKGLIDPNVSYTEAEIKEFIMMPGFSTAEVVDNISGRGVGMDVVKTQILKIGGKVDIKSELNQGSTFTLEVPVNHAIMNGTVIEIRGEQFIVPTINVKEILQPKEEQWIFTQQKRTMLRVRDNIISIIPHSVYFKNSNMSDDFPLVLLLELDQELKALPIDNVVNRQEVVVKPVGEEFSHLNFISGMSILGTGKVSLILDIDYLFKKEVKE